MPGAGYEVRWADGLPVVATPVEIDVTNAAEFRQSLLCSANGSHSTLVVDMSRTMFCDSTGLHQLVRARRRALAAGGEVRLVVKAPPVLRLFTIMGIDQLFPVFPTLAEAVAGEASPAPHHGACPTPGSGPHRPAAHPATVLPASALPRPAAGR